MKLTSKQAAEKLGVTSGTVTKWGDAGLLARWPTGGGTKKRHFLYDSVSVNEFKASRGIQKLSPGSVAAAKENGNYPEAESPVKVFKVQHPLDAAVKVIAGPGPIMGKLDRIEALLEQVLRLWS